ncbi:hypothetical protein, conserved [Plasmodium gonderi]|uniref:Cilia- and flagella-associated protein 251 n=1 Tax=Plasmodium gonderi TaxID=77519 RepID=A0A1Y1JD06_PLAGO|nr:hypothetical protein, conserved [Plasmodium gonderi]GAW80120.1 hypothetical protein, conserved [Plasmodium gonderi]
MQNEHVLDEPITLKLCYGINESFNSVHVVKKCGKEENAEKWHGDPLIVYSSDNNIVMLDGKRQLLFRGHFSKISKLIKSYNNEFIVSCDKGVDSFIILWKINNNSLFPVKKFFFKNSHNYSDKNELKKNVDSDIAYGRDTQSSVNTPRNTNAPNDENLEYMDEEQINQKDIENVGYECVDISFDNRYICALTEKRLYVKGDVQRRQKSLSKINSKSNAVFYQEILIFDTNGGENNIVCKDKIYGKETQEKIRFNRKYEVISNSKSKLYIYNFEKKNRTISHYSPSLYKSNKLNERFIFTETSFVENSTTLLTGTTSGYLIVWDYSSIFINKTKQNIKQREYQKYLEIRKNISINIVQSYGNFIVLGLSDGSVQIFDKDLKCYAWFENSNIGQIKSLSFELSNFEEDFFSWNSFILFTSENFIKQIYPSSFNDKGNVTKLDNGQTDQICITDTWNLESVNKEEFHDRTVTRNDGKNNEAHNEINTAGQFDADEEEIKVGNTLLNNLTQKKEPRENSNNTKEESTTRYSKCIRQKPRAKKNKVLLHFNSQSISAICINPASDESFLYIGNENGVVEIFDFDKNEKIHTIDLASKEIVSMTFSNNGHILCVGCKCGFIQMINATTFQIFFSSKDMKYEITYLYFSEDDKILISSSQNANLIIYKNENCDNIYDWKFTYRIVNNNNITFTDLNVVKEVHKKNEYIIIGITNNRYIIFHHYNFKENTVTISYLLIEQVYAPTCISQNLYFYNRQILCICNEASKIRFFDLETKKIIKTVHLPFKEKNVKKIFPLMSSGEGNYCTFNPLTDDTISTDVKELNEKEKNNFDKNNIFLFVLNEKMIVFTQTPIVPNCFRYIGGIVSSGTIKNVISKNQNIFILSNNKIFYYHINTHILRKNIEIQSNTLEIFVEQIGGKNSKIYNQIMDSFYYCEIQKKKYQQKKEKHDIKKLLNVLSIEYIFASINVFLSKFEIQNIIQEYHFYYKYVLPLLRARNASVNESLFMGDITLVNYKSDSDLLLQNIYFVQNLEETDTQTDSAKYMLNDSHAEMSSSQHRKEEKKGEDKEDKNCEDNKPNDTNLSVTDNNTHDGDITAECEYIYFNINAFIYTYFNFFMEYDINLEKVIHDIENYYKKNNNKKKISCNDFLEMVKNHGEPMDQNEFRRIFQIFTKSEKFLEDADTFDFSLLTEFLQ